MYTDMPIPLFSKDGEERYSFWLADNSRDFSFMPAIPGYFDCLLPIRLHVGSPDFGEIHLSKHHHKWPRQMQKMSSAAIVYHQLGGAGSVWCTEVNKKIKVALSISPASLLILERRYIGADNYWSVTSLYPTGGRRFDGEIIGRYPGVPGRILRG